MCMRLPCRGGSLSPGPPVACGRNPQEGGGLEILHIWETADFPECHHGACGQGTSIGERAAPWREGSRVVWAGRVPREAQ